MENLKKNKIKTDGLLKKISEINS